jgi:hypothetical protein
MDDATYQKMMDMATGRLPRDQVWLDQQAQLGHVQEELEAKARAAKEQPVLSHREMELAQREFDLKHFGKTAMERNARPLEAGESRLMVPGDHRDLQGHEAGEKRPVPPRGLKLHHGEPIRQKLVLQRG